jgi:hypothetical protein
MLGGVYGSNSKNLELMEVLSWEDGQFMIVGHALRPHIQPHA